MSIVLQSSGGGSVTIAEPATASNFTQTLPASDGTVMVSGNMPAFSAYATSNQSISSATFTKITLDTEVFDTNSNFASSRFTPTVAGYYQVNGNMRCGGTVKTVSVVAIYKNGSVYGYGNQINGTGAVQLVVSEVVYLNGSTDYVELYGYVDATSPTFEYATTSANCRFSASLVRGA
jgi:hypothetical protein